MSTQTETRKIPTPIYAAAGAGDLAYEQLRKLRGRVADLRPAVTEAVTEHSLRADLDKLRDTARRNAAAFVTGAQAAQDRAVAVYTDLVARGERIVAGARTAEARTQLATAKAEVKSAESTEAKASSEHRAADRKEAEATRLLEGDEEQKSGARRTRAATGPRQ